MNGFFSSLTADKRNKLLGIAAGVLLLTVALYLTVWSAQNSRARVLKAELQKAQSQDKTFRKTLQSGPSVMAELAMASNKLAELEAEMAQGDLYLWMYTKIKTFQQKYQNKIEIPDFGSVDSGEMTLLPEFPYKQVRIGIRGTAYFHDLGRFIADFENSFPLMRIQNLSIVPMQAATSSEDTEKVRFTCDVVALVNPSQK